MNLRARDGCTACAEHQAIRSGQFKGQPGRGSQQQRNSRPPPHLLSARTWIQSTIQQQAWQQAVAINWPSSQQQWPSSSRLTEMTEPLMKPTSWMEAA